MSPLSSITRLKRAVTAAVVHRAGRRRSLQSAKQVFGGLPPSLWNCDVSSQGHLSLDGVSLVELAGRFGTPLHVVSRRQLSENVESFLQPFRAHLPRVQLASSYKTNPVPGVLRALHDSGTMAEVISHFELWMARRLGVPGSRIIFNGPGKTPQAIQEAVQAGVRLINIDGEYEIPLIAAAAAEANRRQAVGIRVVTSVGWSGQFGLSIANGAALQAFRQVLACPQLRAAGIHLHLGTGVKDVAMYARAVSEVLRFAAELKTKLGIRLETFDLGGGFGVPTVRARTGWDERLISHGYSAPLADPEQCPRPGDYADALVPMFKQFLGGDLAGTEVIFEPGRAITSSPQVLLLKILSEKVAAGQRRTVILDGGKNLTLPLEWETHQIFPIGKMNDAASVDYDLCGPLCHPGDFLSKQKRLPPLRPGDLVAVMDAGAYFIPNQMNFSQPRPAIVMLEGRHVRCLRSREQFEDLVRLDQFEESSNGG